MTDTDILAFLKARLDEDEQTARASARLDGSDWADRDGPTPGFGVVSGYDGGLCESDAADAHLMHRPTAGHIALHDPSRVLREVAAKRRALDLLEASQERDRWMREATGTAPLSAATGAYREVVKTMAGCWSDHPDYNPSWSIDGGR